MNIIHKILKILKNNFIKPKTKNIDQINEYLSDNVFDQGLTINLILEDEIKQSRESLILETVRNKKNIHIGCVDHLPIVDQKIKNGTWLHKNLTDISVKCIGIDNNKEGIKYIQEIGFNNVYYQDLLEPNNEVILSEYWDYMILGEIIEHVDNPINFLKKINTLYKDRVGKMIITTPNAYSYTTFKNSSSGYEMINSDHRTLFTPYTLLKTLFIADFKNIKINFADPTNKIHHKFINLLLPKKYKISCIKNQSSTLVFIADFK